MTTQSAEEVVTCEVSLVHIYDASVHFEDEGIMLVFDKEPWRELGAPSRVRVVVAVSKED